MKKIFLLLVFTCIIRASNVYAISYKEYKIGDKIEYKGDEYFVISDSNKESDILTTIKAKPLTVDEINSYGIVGHINVNTNESKGTAYNMNGYGAIAYYSDYNQCGFNIDTGDIVSDFYSTCFLVYHLSDIKYILDAWAKDKLSQGDLMVDDEMNEYRLVNNNDLIRLDYEKNSSGKYVKTSTTPSFMYNENYSYWIMHEYGEENNKIDRSYIDSSGNVQEFDGNLSKEDSTVFDMYAIRPVVNFKKTAIKKASRNSSLGASSYKIGEEVEYKNNKYYVIKNTTEKDPYLTLVKAIPLTVDEVNTLGKGHVNKYDYEYKNTAYNNNGYGGVAFYSSEECIYSKTDKCMNTYETSDIKYIVDAWGNANFEKDELVSIGLLNSADLIELGYDYLALGVSQAGYTYKATLSVYDFLLNLKYAWTLKPYEDSSHMLLVISDNANLKVASVYETTYLIYPVIKIKNPGYVAVVKSPDTKQNKIYILEIVGILLAIVFGSSYLVFSKTKRSN